MEQRQHPRFSVRMRTILGPVDAEDQEGTIYNVSLGGCAIRTPTAIDSDMLTSLQIFTPDYTEPILISGAIKRWGKGSLNCFQFLTMSTENQARLQHVLNQLNHDSRQ